VTVTDPLITAAQFLQAQLGWLRHATDEQGSPVAVDVFREIQECASRMRSIVDGPADQRFLGPCGAELCASTYEGWVCKLAHEHPTRHTAGDGGLHNGATWISYHEPRPPRVCDGDVYGRPSAEKGRCRTCGAEVDQADRLAWIDEVRREWLYTATEIAEAYPDIKANTISKWASRGLLEARGKHGNSPLYLVGEVLDLAAGDAARREEARARRAARQTAEMGA
jgi:hypothetical protein